MHVGVVRKKLADPGIGFAATPSRELAIVIAGVHIQRQPELAHMI
jgi:hypothetical protein